MRGDDWRPRVVVPLAGAPKGAQVRQPQQERGGALLGGAHHRGPAQVVARQRGPPAGKRTGDQPRRRVGAAVHGPHGRVVALCLLADTFVHVCMRVVP